MRTGKDAASCPQPHRLRLFAYAMGLVAADMEARKFGLATERSVPNTAPEPQGIPVQMPGGMSGIKPR